MGWEPTTYYIFNVCDDCLIQAYDSLPESPDYFSKENIKYLRETASDKNE